MVLTSGDVSIYLIIGKVQKVTKWFPGVEMTFTMQAEICFLVPYSQIIKRNNQIIKIIDPISQITCRSCRSVQCWHASLVNTVIMGMGDRIVMFSFDLVKLCG